jgi:hypothetical protein
MEAEKPMGIQLAQNASTGQLLANTARGSFITRVYRKPGRFQFPTRGFPSSFMQFPSIGLQQNIIFFPQRVFFLSS